MALPSCRRCGKTDPQRMHGLMSLWFGPLVELEADLGYFYLCPACHDELIVPELERIQNRILELHPAAQRHLDEIQHQPGDDSMEAEAGEGADENAAAGDGGEEEEGDAGQGEGAGKKDGGASPDAAEDSDPGVEPA